MDKQKIKRIIPKVIFVLSFLPIVLILIGAIHAAVAGFVKTDWVGTYTGTSYGWEGFKNYFFWNSLGWCIIPVLPVMAIYQLVFIIIAIVKNSKARRIVPKVIFFLSFLPIVIILIGAVHAMFAGYTEYDYLNDFSAINYYGVEAFGKFFSETALGWSVVPILPVMAIYQLVFIIVSIVKKVKNKKTN